MKTILILSLLLLVSCGKHKHEESITVKYVENTFDDSKLVAYNTIQDAKLATLETRTHNLELLTSSNSQDYETLRVQIESNYTQMLHEISLVQTQIDSSNKVSVLQICSSNENLIKVNNDFYAVYMINDDYGTYLGKLTSNVNYQTTDIHHSRFTITNGNIVCQ